MSTCNENKNPLQRNGTSQPQRLLPAQSPDAAPVMDKGPLDWMVWGSRLSQSIKYYNASNVAEGNMHSFFASDIAACLAMVATHPPAAIPHFVREQLIILTTNANSSKTALLRRTFTSLFDVVFGYLERVAHLQQQLLAFEQQQPGLLLEIDVLYQVNNHLELRLKPLLQRAVCYFKAASTATLTAPTPTGIIDIFNYPIATAESVMATGLGSSWFKPYTSWNDLVISLPEDASIFGIATTISGKIQQAAQHNFFTGLLDEVNGSAAFLAALAAQSVAKLMQEWPNHGPHYALYLAWLQLMEHAAAGMNALPAQHLQFYYEQVLRLKPRPATPSKAFLSIELNKAVAQSELPANTTFIGGKNETGGNILYSNSQPTVLSKAAIASVQSIYLAGPQDVASGVSLSGRLYASPIANSEDGLGKKLTNPLGAWHPFYQKIYSNGELQSISMPGASVGFAIASHYLRLKEGKRKIVLKINTSNNAALAGKVVQVFITTPKKWLEIGTLIFANGKMNNGITNGLLLSTTLSADLPAISGYTPAIHGHRFTTNEPVLKIVLPNNGMNNAATVASLSNMQLLSADLEVQVGDLSGAYNTDGLKNLALQNDAGVLNAAKPFQPFGNEPTPGNALTIGSDELFYKPNARIQLNIEWKDLPASTGNLDFDFDSNAEYQSIPSTNDPYYPEIDFETLEAGNWKKSGTKLNLFPAAGNRLLPNATFTSAVLGPQLFVAPAVAIQPFNAAATAGFVRLKLKHDFGHRNYRQALSWYLMEKGKSNPNVQEPAMPYNPVMQMLSISYNAQCSYSPGVASDALQWWHLAPFGDALAKNNNLPILPNLIDNTTPLAAQGSLFIGLSNAMGGQTVSLLFQMMEGTENPLQSKPSNHLNWHYLANNTWMPFADNAINDGTSQWLQSGIIKLVLPTDATLENTLHAPGLIWVKAQVATAPDAAAKIIGIHSNAVEVVQQFGTNITPSTSIAPNGTISKMLTPDGFVKKVQQPYASFGGTNTEEKEAYYVRISERLKHKDRAVTIWDYERLVLQQFPEIYKVKCLNHTKISGSTTNGTFQYQEVAPGYVAIITIPNLQQRNDADPLKPYTKKSTLEAIEKMLQARSSCHVSITAAQPLFEELRIAATVMLASGYEDINYYRQLLQQEITEFLCPWAFGKQTAIEFGGSIHKSVLINFIEERPYVDFLTDVKLFHKPGDAAPEGNDEEEVIATTGRSILISAAANKHQFNMQTPAAILPTKEKCKNV